MMPQIKSQVRMLKSKLELENYSTFKRHSLTLRTVCKEQI